MNELRGAGSHRRTSFAAEISASIVLRPVDHLALVRMAIARTKRPGRSEVSEIVYGAHDAQHKRTGFRPN